MKTFFSALILSGLSLADLQAAPGVGDPAPDFKMTGSDGKEYSLDQFKGKQAVVIAWYPLSFTGG